VREAGTRGSSKLEGGEQATTVERGKREKAELAAFRGLTVAVLFSLLLSSLSIAIAINRHKIAAANLQTIEYTEL